MTYALADPHCPQAHPVRDGRGPGAFAGHGGSTGTISFHNSSSMTHALLTTTEGD
jgi:hypothetical protein